jgi:ABC-type branched-subunit amino acid transport system ATPase component
MSEILKINNLWGGYKEGVDILRGISMDVQQGEAVGIIGLNGSGKSTFGKAIMNMIPIRKGEIFFEGEDITSLTTSQLSHRGISIMQQGGKVFQNLSVWDNMQLASKGDFFSLADIIPLLQKSKKELQGLMADKLSGGQKHQLSLAMTLATNPRFVILDEPSAGLSPKSVEDMYKLLQEVRRVLDITIVLIEQNITKAISYCDVSMLLEMGKFTSQIKATDSNKIEELLFKQ